MRLRVLIAMALTAQRQLKSPKVGEGTRLLVIGGGVALSDDVIAELRAPLDIVAGLLLVTALVVVGAPPGECAQSLTWLVSPSGWVP